METLLDYPCSCGGKLKRSFCTVEFFGISFGERPCEVCTTCDSEFLDDAVLHDIEAEVKKKRIFGLQEEIQATKSGNSLVFRVPPKIAKFAGITTKTRARMYPADKSRIEIELV
ncbi:hypothetical protein HY641_00100 [Candidatus Woesearchaeota archaeon]|nr:hypothetical protein [Candidatus Woesearchaeota archaeon]